MSGQFQPIVRGRILDDIVTRIRDQVRQGKLSPGDKLPPERVLAQQLQVSRPVLREALRTLEIGGIVELRKGRSGGAFISEGKNELFSDYLSDLIGLGTVNLGEVMEARRAIGEVVVRWAIERATEEDFAAMDENIRQAEELYAKDQMREKTFKVIEFHTVLAQATHNPIMIMVVNSLGRTFEGFVRLGSDRSRAVFASRRRFVAALRACDVDLALEEMRSDLDRVESLYRNMFRSSVSDD